MEEVKRNYFRIAVDDVGFLYFTNSNEHVNGCPVGDVKLVFKEAPHTIDDVINAAQPPKLANAFNMVGPKTVMIEDKFFQVYGIQFYKLFGLPKRSETNTVDAE
ncbi:hypothetical protein HY485_03570 [Candidatus Woesearchaeota archaeon]|nr:hypothetical protein [Candidatus Woesearchaeota archaeon]